jgi:hypothetical protein
VRFPLPRRTAARTRPRERGVVRLRVLAAWLQCKRGIRKETDVVTNVVVRTQVKTQTARLGHPPCERKCVSSEPDMRLLHDAFYSRTHEEAHKAQRPLGLRAPG